MTGINMKNIDFLLYGISLKRLAAMLLEAVNALPSHCCGDVVNHKIAVNPYLSLYGDVCKRRLQQRPH